MKCRGKSRKYKKVYQQNRRGQVDPQAFDHHQFCTRCFTIRLKIDYGQCNHRTLSDGAKIYEWHKTCKACRDGDKRRNCDLNRTELQ